MLVATALTMGVNAWADEVTATLDHTAGAQWGSNTGASTVDAEKEHYNNDAQASWAGCAYAKFSFTIPAGHSITKAVLTYSVNQGGRSGRNDIIYYMADGFDLDWSTFAGQTGTDLRNASNRAGKAVESAPTGGTGDRLGLTQEVTEAVKAIYDKGQSYILFQWTGNAGGADLYGKPSANAPSLVITTADASTRASYTVKFVCDGTEIKEAEKREGNIGESVAITEADMAPIRVEGKKYIYTSGNTSELIAADGSTVVTLTFREAATMNYSVVSNLGTTIAEGSDYEGETIAVGYPHYILDKGVLYECPKNDSNPWYAVSITLNEATNTATVDYSESVIANVIFVSEGEALPGATVNNGGNYSDIRSFGAAVGYAAEDLTVTTLQPGKYTIKADLFTPTSAMGSQTFKVGDKEFKLTSTNNGYHNELETEEFELTEATDVVLLAGGGNTNAIDWLYIRGIVTTGISQMQADSNAQQAIFNLQGQQVKQAQKGLYIIDGKKVMVK